MMALVCLDLAKKSAKERPKAETRSALAPRPRSAAPPSASALPPMPADLPFAERSSFHQPFAAWLPGVRSATLLGPADGRRNKSNSTGRLWASDADRGRYWHHHDAPGACLSGGWAAQIRGRAEFPERRLQRTPAHSRGVSYRNWRPRHVRLFRRGWPCDRRPRAPDKSAMGRRRDGAVQCCAPFQGISRSP